MNNGIMILLYALNIIDPLGHCVIAIYLTVFTCGQSAVDVMQQRCGVDDFMPAIGPDSLLNACLLLLF